MSIFTKKKAYDFSIYGFGQLINLASPLIVIPFLITTCGEEGLGKIGVGFSMALILNAIIDYGSYIIGVREIAIHRENPTVLNEKINAIYGSKFILLIFVLTLFSLLIFIVPFFSREKEMFFLSLVIVVGQCFNPAWFFQGIENFKWISFINILSKTIYLAGVFFFINKESDFIYVNLFFGLGLLISSLIGFFWLIHSFKFKITLSNLKKGKTIIKEEFSFSVSQFFLSIHQYFPIVIVSYVLGDFAAGQYRIIDQLLSLFKTYLNMIFYFVYANICHELNKSLQGGLKVWKQYNGLNFLLLFVVSLVFFFNSDYIVSFFNIDSNEIAPVSFLLKIGLLIPFLISLSQPLRQLIFAFSENRFYVRVTIYSTLLNVVLMLIFSYFYGLIGTLYSILFVEFIVLILYSFILKDRFNSQSTIS
ncbi:MAG TPA: oligosaccharide flippase family protein [Flavobacterium sp.]|uniref:oligosaccharide flippase family protein n=2 Tax=Flavobacterium TaxID=237 RepID=UPI0025C247A7|nr:MULTISPECIES: oligosaccharide flippase family protein [unclassified Flavobacterium]HRE77838.1 oligosaccharide flippase family protein [Flavobacterium sp.]